MQPDDRYFAQYDDDPGIITTMIYDVYRETPTLNEVHEVKWGTDHGTISVNDSSYNIYQTYHTDPALAVAADLIINEEEVTLAASSIEALIVLIVNLNHRVG